MEGALDWYLMVWRKYADFDGRSRRKEYWMFTLFNFLLVLVVMVIAILIGTFLGVSSNNGLDNTTLIQISAGLAFLLLFIYFLAALIPSLAVSVRRLHDTGKSGWLLLLFFVLGLIPIIGFITAIIQIVFMCQDSDPGVNQYGPNPKFHEQARMAAGYAGYGSLGFGAQPQPFTSAANSGYCINCGIKFQDSSLFCNNCGIQR